VNDALVLVADGQIMGEVRQDERGRLILVYDPAWRGLAQAWPLSLSLPLVVAEHEHGRVLPWLRGLLPDDPAVLERWGQQFNVSPRDPFALLGAVGEDCAGAVQFVRPQRVAAVLDAKPMTVDWLTRNTMAERLRGLRKDRAAWRLPRDAGQCSLAGVTPKTALFFNGQHWGIPSGRTPTTHILKLPADPAAGLVQNAYLCLALARILGLPTARAHVMRFDDHVALTVERYDRVRDNGGFRRLHQEDLCQALGLPPAKKNQADGGPTPARMIEIIRAHSGAPHEDAWTFARALMLRWLIASPDGHAKNSALLIGSAGRARLAPLYGLTSALPAVRADAMPLALATHIGGDYEIDRITRQHWQKFAAAARLPASDVVERCRSMAAAMPDALHAAARQARGDGVDHPVVGRLVALLSARADRCLRTLAA